MAEVAAVRLTLTDRSLLDRVGVRVEVDLRFAPNEIHTRETFRLFVAIRSSDVGEDDEGPDLYPPYLHVFGPRTSPFVAGLLGLDNYHRVKAVAPELTETFEEEMLLSKLDEDPGTDEVRLGVFRNQEIIIRVPREDEVVAHVKLFREIQSINSSVQTVPGSGDVGLP